MRKELAKELTYAVLIAVFFWAIAIAAFLVISGCASSPYSQQQSAAMTPKEKAQIALNRATIGAQFIVPPAITAWLLMEKDVEKQQQDAAWVYAGASALNALATGTTPTPIELQSWIRSFTKDNPRSSALAQLLASEYTQLYRLFAIAETNPAKFFSEIAVQAQNAARPFLKPTP